ncbi:nucleoside triphosphate pyrophosphohydrolase [uncultured Enorma sp.]|uniref:nucleoside triphosphate pyrophosphohydrolase n=1 Tax=uncultured Enorma sp. TaxID=1714346 RepID=UPI0028048C1F|nr:nucleoside triphosphate pyrophosphohydrolase [uncultured Enorma sp.]
MSETRDMAMPRNAGERDRSTRIDASEAFDALTETIWRLRQPDGCPWDREQTHASIAKNMVEEAYEAVDCIEEGDEVHLCEELGDVLMQVMLHAQIAADEGSFTIDDVVRGLDEKLVRRHPHVFGDRGGAHDAAEVLDIWDQVKLAEKAQGDAEAVAAEGQPKSLLDSVPRALPALMQAQKVSRKAAAVGFEWDTVDDVWAQVGSERAEFEREEPGSEARAMEFGDMLFALVNVARREGIDAESALRASTMKFRARWEAVEHLARECGTSVEELSTAELNRLWDEVKAGE